MKNRMLSARNHSGLSHQSRSRKVRWIKIAIILPLAAVFIAWGATLVIPAPASSQKTLLPPADPEQIQRGAYLARVGDCIACHSRAGEPPFSGGGYRLTDWRDGSAQYHPG